MSKVSITSEENRAQVESLVEGISDLSSRHAQISDEFDKFRSDGTSSITSLQTSKANLTKKVSYYYYYYYLQSIISCDIEPLHFLKSNSSQFVIN